MKIKNSELFDKKTSLDYLSSKELPIKVSYKLAKIFRVINTELQDVIKVKNDLIKKYGTTNSEGNQVISADSPNMKEFEKEIAPVLEEEVELDFEQIPLEEFGDIKIESKYLMDLLDFIICP